MVDLRADSSHCGPAVSGIAMFTASRALSRSPAHCSRSDSGPPGLVQLCAHMFTRGGVRCIVALLAVCVVCGASAVLQVLLAHQLVPVCCCTS